MTYDLIIIGGGPGGVAAGVYAARKKLKTLLVTPEFGGQSVVSEAIENWIGTVKIPGQELADNLKKHLLAYAGDVVDVHEGEGVVDIKKSSDGVGFVVSTGEFATTTPGAQSSLTADGTAHEYETRAVLVATGSHRRKLDIPGAAQYDNKGLTYCASCDGPLYGGQDVVVVGGGNAALESAAQLLAYCKSVTLLNRSETLRGDEVTIAKLSENKNFKVIKNALPVEVLGDKFVTGIVYEDAVTHEKHTVATPGIFVEIGLLPTTDFAKNILTLNAIGQIPTNPANQQTAVPGIWAAGDCTDGHYHQNNIAAGDAVRALEDIYVTLRTK